MRSILVVDDQPGVLASLAFVFTSAGFSVLLASNGPQALALAETQSFDAALIDLHMPGTDGTVVCRTLVERSQSQPRKPLLWMMTAAYTQEAAAKCLEAGARRLLKKPFDLDELIREIAAGDSAPPFVGTAPPIGSGAATCAVA